ncbi:MAG: alpha/beta hydrolase [Candidatus Omnitrophica bacterium]|nr:alpha/beta hydrolase [bacterium]MBK7497189.1 alpha/beta hydrolase [Candidatus Omnitrophota bacterium]MCE7907504.1 alpha/beta hydrolase [Candidatus Omnitrophica bacterium COP1]MBV6480519.1 hypothetical protein [bacterium]MCC6732898.1 alpha/beta hydrolase [Candidatus Omnitrophota bacterium]
MPFNRRIFRNSLIFLGLFLILLLVGLTLVRLWWESSFFAGYVAGLPLIPDVLETREEGPLSIEKVRFQSQVDEMIPAEFYFPKDATEELPCVVVLYGAGNGMADVKGLAQRFISARCCVLAPEIFGLGERKASDPEGSSTGVLATREKFTTTVIDGQRCIDFLHTRLEVDAEKINLIGVNLGAIAGTTVMSLEPRYRAAILVWGGGNLSKIFSVKGLTGSEGFFQDLAFFLLSPIEPLNHVRRIAPRPVLFQNAEKDEMIPRACVEELYNKAGTPKDIKWYDCGHQEGISPDMIDRMVNDQISWLKSVKAM